MRARSERHDGVGLEHHCQSALLPQIIRGNKHRRRGRNAHRRLSRREHPQELTRGVCIQCRAGGDGEDVDAAVFNDAHGIVGREECQNRKAVARARVAVGDLQRELVILRRDIAPRGACVIAAAGNLHAEFAGVVVVYAEVENFVVGGEAVVFARLNDLPYFPPGQARLRDAGEHKLAAILAEGVKMHKRRIVGEQRYARRAEVCEFVNGFAPAFAYCQSQSRLRRVGMQIVGGNHRADRARRVHSRQHDGAAHVDFAADEKARQSSHRQHFKTRFAAGRQCAADKGERGDIGKRAESHRCLRLADNGHAQRIGVVNRHCESCARDGNGTCHIPFNHLRARRERDDRARAQCNVKLAGRHRSGEQIGRKRRMPQSHRRDSAEDIHFAALGIQIQGKAGGDGHNGVVFFADHAQVQRRDKESGVQRALRRERVAVVHIHGEDYRLLYRAAEVGVDVVGVAVVPAAQVEGRRVGVCALEVAAQAVAAGRIVGMPPSVCRRVGRQRAFDSVLHNRRTEQVLRILRVVLQEGAVGSFNNFKLRRGVCYAAHIHGESRRRLATSGGGVVNFYARANAAVGIHAGIQSRAGDGEVAAAADGDGVNGDDGIRIRIARGEKAAHGVYRRHRRHCARISESVQNRAAKTGDKRARDSGLDGDGELGVNGHCAVGHHSHCQSARGFVDRYDGILNQREVKGVGVPVAGDCYQIRRQWRDDSRR